MLPEDAIILALNQPRNFTQLYLEASNKRKEVGESLAKQTFIDALKRLVDHDYVLVKTKGKAKEFSLNRDKKITDDQLQRQDAIKKFREGLKMFLGLVSFRADGKRTKDIEKKEILFFEKMTKVVMIFADCQRLVWYLLHSGYSDEIKKRHLRNEICEYEKIIKDTLDGLRKVNPELAQRMHVSLVSQMHVKTEN